MDKQSDPQLPAEEDSRGGNALVFISHDSRDAEIAEAFSQLIRTVSGGMLKSFRSSDKKGNQGIEYGTEWYPKIMKKLEVASDVVCLLTRHSINRPWILFEAGVAKGKLNTSVLGVALGIPLSAAASGPFFQFQNVDDDVDSLTGLVIQLVRRNPNADPDRDFVKIQVEAFKQKVQPLLDKQKLPEDRNSNEKQDETSVAKIFEEIKVMFQDLPDRIGRRVDPESSMNRKRMGRMPLRFMDEIAHGNSIELGDNLEPLMVGSAFKEDFPWLYEEGIEVYRKLESRHPDAADALHRFVKLMNRTAGDPMMWDLQERSPGERAHILQTLLLSKQVLGRIAFRTEKANPALNADAGDKAARAD